MRKPVSAYLFHPQHVRVLVFMAVVVTACCLITVNLVCVAERLGVKSFIQRNLFQRTSIHSKYNNPYTKAGVDHNANASQHRVMNKTKLILLWSPMFNGFDFLQEGKSSFKNSNCAENRCEITSDRRRLLDSHAVVFHVRTMSLMDIPRFRNVNQKWIFFSLEAPPYSQFQGLYFMSDMFNWTMTYRNDSNIVIRYGNVKFNSGNRQNETNLYLEWKRKNRTAVCLVSHCSTDGNREEFLEEMEHYIDLDMYGECGLGICPYNKTEKCLENFSKRYIFFMAFENAICKDYITEKFFRTLRYNMIPVVFGGGSYLSLAPPNSYINAMDFPSPKELSSHLLKVASNFTIYAKYFKWKFDGYDVRDKPNHCGLCKKLHSDSFYEWSVYHDINKWWVKESDCKRWNQ